MTAALEGGTWSARRPGRTLPPGKTRYPFYRRLSGPQGRFGRAENLAPTGIRSRTVQPVVSRYTDWATRSTVLLFIWKEMEEPVQKMTRLKAGRRKNQVSISFRNKRVSLFPQYPNSFEEHTLLVRLLSGGFCLTGSEQHFKMANSCQDLYLITPALLNWLQTWFWILLFPAVTQYNGHKVSTKTSSPKASANSEVLRLNTLLVLQARVLL